MDAPEVAVSCANGDQTLARLVVCYLKEGGVKRVHLYDPMKLAKAAFEDVLRNTYSHSAVVLMVMGKNYLTSGFCAAELSVCLERQRQTGRCRDFLALLPGARPYRDAYLCEENVVHLRSWPRPLQLARFARNLAGRIRNEIPSESDHLDRAPGRAAIRRHLNGFRDIYARVASEATKVQAEGDIDFTRAAHAGLRGTAVMLGLSEQQERAHKIISQLEAMRRLALAAVKSWDPSEYASWPNTVYPRVQSQLNRRAHALLQILNREREKVDAPVTLFLLDRFKRYLERYEVNDAVKQGLLDRLIDLLELESGRVRSSRRSIALPKSTSERSSAMMSVSHSRIVRQQSPHYLKDLIVFAEDMRTVTNGLRAVFWPLRLGSIEDPAGLAELTRHLEKLESRIRRVREEAHGGQHAQN